MEDLPFYCIGFKSAAPEFTLRTCIWATLRAQTLYRTASGRMNYTKAIKLLYCVENREVVQQLGGNITPGQLSSEVQEKQHALYIFNLLKNLIKPSSGDPPL
jgi:hypothetical protein